MSKVRLVITSSGMAGHRFIGDFLDRSDAANFSITVFCEEPRTVYDHVHLSSYLSHHIIEELSLVCEGLYEKCGTKALVGGRAITINRQEKVVHSSAGRIASYDKLIMATGSYPWILPIKGSDIQDCFVYCTIEDLNAIESCTRRSKRGTVAGGGLLGSEVTGALKSLGIETHVIKFTPMLMAEQFDQMGGEQLRRKIESTGARVHIGKNTLEIIQEGTKVRKIVRFADGSELEVDFIVFSAGIRPHDKLVIQRGPDVAPRGGVVIGNSYQTSDLDVYAIDERVSQNSHVLGLVALDYKIVQVTVDRILGSESALKGTDLSTKLKLLGVDIGGVGDTHGHTPSVRSYVYLDESKEIYKRLVVSEDSRILLGAVLMGNINDYDNLLQLVLNAIELPESPGFLILPAHSGNGKPSIDVDKLPDSAQVRSYPDITKGDLIVAINRGCHIVATLKVEARAGTGCGGCTSLVTQVLDVELAKQGIEVSNDPCERLAYSRQELSHLIRVEGIKTFEELLVRHDKDYGCEVCKLTIGSLLAPCWNEYILKPGHTPLQDFNDNFFANIQKDGIYSVIPRFPGGEITPEELIAVGHIARELNLYTKITGSQHPTMFDVQKDDLPEIWRQLTEASFEIGHIYAEVLRIVKTRVGSTWCRCGVDDSVDLGVELENRYKGIRTLYKVKFGVSGCTYECSEAQGKDVGITATERDWSLYVRGNGGMKPRHTDLLTADIDCETLIKYLGRFMMFYIRITDKLARIAPWLENFEGGIDYPKTVTINDKLELSAHLEEKMARLREVTVCERTETVNTSSVQVRFKRFINSGKRDSNVQMVPEREQHRPAMPYERIPATLVEGNA